MDTNTIRKKFVEYFRKHGHHEVASSPVIPHDDPTLLFINAGMNQFKDVFLGRSRRDYQRAVTAQKCVRVGGKHNDLENVGHTKRHLTFFEMLGNFSFGDYFKKEAIQFAWDVSTSIFQFPEEKLWASVYQDDDEAFELWRAYLPESKIVRFGDADNFWAMGDTGPCGPCSELFYDRGAHYSDANSPTQDVDGERYLEFWNVVFMQYNRSADGKQELLKAPSIDTGAGLERIMSLIQDVETVFETDTFRQIISEVEGKVGVRYDSMDPNTAPAFRVIADHLRCLTFAIADGVQPSNLDRGYVLRKVLRRAVRYGRQLGMEKPFLSALVPSLVNLMGDAYPEIKTAQDRIEEIILREEESFLLTLRRGGNILSRIIEDARHHADIISGDEAFKLKDTYGLPLDEITLLAKDSGLGVDTERYYILEQEAKERSKSAHKVVGQEAEESEFVAFEQEHGATQFTGYETITGEGKVVGLVHDNAFVETLTEGQSGLVLTDATCFYAEQGGQVGDHGSLSVEGVTFQVNDCQKPYGGLIAHHGELKEGTLTVGDVLQQQVDGERRAKIANNHSVTHLLHWALYRVLGEHIRQAGSVVDPDRLRFDFSHHNALTAEQVHQIEDLVNEQIRKNEPVASYELAYQEVKERPEIRQFFGDKYGAVVRVVDMGDSKELCGGTHTSHVGTIGLFRIVKEGSIAAGIRRIEAVTGAEAIALCRQADQTVHDIAATLKVQPHKVQSRVEQLAQENKALQKEQKALAKLRSQQQAAELLAAVEEVNGIAVAAGVVDGDAGSAKVLMEHMGKQLPSGVVVLGVKMAPDRCLLMVRVSDDVVEKGLRAGDLIKELAPLVGGGGGGKANTAQAGGKEPSGLPKALERARELLGACVS